MSRSGIKPVSQAPNDLALRALTWGYTVSEGDLNTQTRGNLPGSGKSCNKSNRSGVNAPGYSAVCSLFVCPPTWPVHGWGGRCKGICSPKTARPGPMPRSASSRVMG